MTPLHETLPFVHVDSPVGRLEIRATRAAIVRVDIERDRWLPGDAALPLDGAPSPTPDPGKPDPAAAEVLDEACRQLDAYFAGTRRAFDLPLAEVGTPFQREIWAALLEVPFGRPTSYGELAGRTGRPTGARAVGGAVGSNPIALFVPCHRVLGTGRRLTGYSPGEGIPTKRWLLAHEGIDFAP